MPQEQVHGFDQLVTRLEAGRVEVRQPDEANSGSSRFLFETTPAVLNLLGRIPEEGLSRGEVEGLGLGAFTKTYGPNWLSGDLSRHGLVEERGGRYFVTDAAREAEYVTGVLRSRNYGAGAER